MTLGNPIKYKNIIRHSAYNSIICSKLDTFICYEIRNHVVNNVPSTKLINEIR